MTKELLNHPVTIRDTMSDVVRRLTEAGVENARLDARVLIAHAMGVGQEVIVGYPERDIAPDIVQRIESLVRRRENRESLAKVLGRKEFWGLPFKVTGDTLDPRPDSETLVAAALQAIREMDAQTAADQGENARPTRRILDFGTGSGCLLLALLYELPAAVGVGVDRDPAALEVARVNAAALGFTRRIRFCEGDWGQGIEGEFDCIISNPPYIPIHEIDSLAPEVARFEPRTAISGGSDGLKCYREMAPYLTKLLAPWGAAFLEVGEGQAGDVAGILRQNGLKIARVDRDLAGHDRCVMATH